MPNHRIDQSTLLRLAATLANRARPVDLRSLGQLCSRAGVRAHVAVATSDYLVKIVSGLKTIESRFTNTRQSPYGHVSAGDLVLFKAPTRGITVAAQVRRTYYAGPLAPYCAQEIMRAYAKGLALESEFIEAKASARYATLLFLERPVLLPSIRITKRDRRPWVALTHEPELPLSCARGRNRRTIGSR